MNQESQNQYFFCGGGANHVKEKNNEKQDEDTHIEVGSRSQKLMCSSGYHGNQKMHQNKTDGKNQHSCCY